MSFKLPDFLRFDRLNALREQMGAPLCTSFKGRHTFSVIELPIARRLRESGVVVNLADVKALDDSTLSYGTSRVLLYIRDVPNFGQRRRPRYHVAYCETLNDMRRKDRSHKYVVATRDDGLFPVNRIGGKSEAALERLDVCQPCLATIGWEGFELGLPEDRRLTIVARFSLLEFFRQYPKDLIAVKPDHTAETAPRNDYTPDWREVSERTKMAGNHQCEECGRRLVLRRARFLHVHHRNGLKYDNAPRNLQVLCIGCHAIQPLHDHLTASSDYKEYVALFRSAVAR